MKDPSYKHDSATNDDFFSNQTNIILLNNNNNNNSDLIKNNNTKNLSHNTIAVKSNGSEVIRYDGQTAVVTVNAVTLGNERQLDDVKLPSADVKKAVNGGKFVSKTNIFETPPTSSDLIKTTLTSTAEHYDVKQSTISQSDGLIATSSSSSKSSDVLVTSKGSKKTSLVECNGKAVEIVNSNSLNRYRTNKIGHRDEELTTKSLNRRDGNRKSQLQSPIRVSEPNHQPPRGVSEPNHQPPRRVSESSSLKIIDEQQSSDAFKSFSLRTRAASDPEFRDRRSTSTKSGPLDRKGSSASSTGGVTLRRIQPQVASVAEKLSRIFCRSRTHTYHVQRRQKGMSLPATLTQVGVPLAGAKETTESVLNGTPVRHNRFMVY